jgi:hypothetical protein
MYLTATKLKRLIKRKLATTVLISASLAAFATLGDGGKKGDHATSEKLSAKTFSLRTSYNYKSNSLFNTPPKSSNFIMLNTVVTYQKGNAVYVMPLKKKVLLDKIKFNPAQTKN